MTVEAHGSGSRVILKNSIRVILLLPRLEYLPDSFFQRIHSISAMEKMRAEVLRLRDVHDRTNNKETSLNDCVELIKECEESR